jgi:hypothetical protein
MEEGNVEKSRKELGKKKRIEKRRGGRGRRKRKR